MQYLPSKKIVVLMTGIIVMGGFWFALRDTKTVGLSDATNTENILVQNQSDYQDSDNDGLFDWEELLFGTDPSNPDSNGDGILDGEEFASIKKIAGIKPTDDVLNYFNKIGQALSGDGQGSIVPETVLELFPDHYTKQDTSVTETTLETVTTYFAGMLLATTGYVSEEETDNPIEVVSHWLETKDPKDLEMLATISEEQKRVVDALSKLVVPDTLISMHFELINNTYNGALALDDIKITTYNPQAGFFAAAKYANYQTKRSNAIVALTQFYNYYGSSSLSQE